MHVELMYVELRRMQRFYRKNPSQCFREQIPIAARPRIQATRARTPSARLLQVGPALLGRARA